MRAIDPRAYAISLAGIQLDGWADGDFMNIENESDSFTDVVGTDGEVTRMRVLDERATVTFTTQQSSPVNDTLSALLRLDKLAMNGAGVGAFSMRDLNGTSSYFAEHAWIAKRPAAGFGREVKMREWKIRCADMDANDGSNEDT